jgi:hypothetical protein
MTKAKDPAGRVPYQQAGAVRQLLAERANAVTYGQATRVEAVDKQLAELGVSLDEPSDAASGTAPKGRATRESKQTTTDAAAKQTAKKV